MISDIEQTNLIYGKKAVHRQISEQVENSKLRQVKEISPLKQDLGHRNNTQKKILELYHKNQPIKINHRAISLNEQKNQKSHMSSFQSINHNEQLLTMLNKENYDKISANNHKRNQGYYNIILQQKKLVNNSFHNFDYNKLQEDKLLSLKEQQKAYLATIQNQKNALIEKQNISDREYSKHNITLKSKPQQVQFPLIENKRSQSTLQTSNVNNHLFVNYNLQKQISRQNFQNFIESCQKQGQNEYQQQQNKLAKENKQQQIFNYHQQYENKKNNQEQGRISNNVQLRQSNLKQENQNQNQEVQSVNINQFTQSNKQEININKVNNGKLMANMSPNQKFTNDLFFNNLNNLKEFASSNQIKNQLKQNQQDKNIIAPQQQSSPKQNISEYSSIKNMPISSKIKKKINENIISLQGFQQQNDKFLNQQDQSTAIGKRASQQKKEQKKDLSSSMNQQQQQQQQLQYLENTKNLLSKQNSYSDSALIKKKEQNQNVTVSDKKTPKSSFKLFQPFRFDPINPKLVYNVATKSQAGYIPIKGRKTNQDSIFICTRFAGNENYFFFGVLDGHGIFGHFVSAFIKNILPKNAERIFLETFHQVDIAKLKPEEKSNMITSVLFQAFVQTNNDLQQSSIDVSFSGSTAICILIIDKQMYSANAGDSRAIMARNSKLDGWSILPLSRDHKPNDQDEKQRIENCGGRVEPFKDQLGRFIGPHRVWMLNERMPGLAMSRSLGDNVATSIGCTYEPEIFEFVLSENDKFIILGSDGIFEFVSNVDVIQTVLPFYKKNNPDAACDKLIKEATLAWKKEDEVIDDITCIVIFLKFPGQQVELKKQSIFQNSKNFSDQKE